MKTLVLAAAMALTWSARENRQIQSLSLSQLPPLESLPKFGSNRFAFDPKARSLGERLFFDEGLSKSHAMACATCHAAAKSYADERVIATKDRGLRSVPTLLGVGWLDFYFWDGRADSIWSLVLGPLTSVKEHDLSPAALKTKIEKSYAKDYESLFGKVKDHGADLVLANVGKAIEAYVVTIRPAPGAFDAYADALGKGPVPAAKDLAPCAKRGLKLFLGRGTCINCHNGPLFTNGYFHNIGVPLASVNDLADGRYAGDKELVNSAYNCIGPFSDAKADQARICAEAIHAGGSMLGAYKTPTLRAVSKTAPYMHNGAYGSLKQVLMHYNQRLAAPVGETETVPLGLKADELDDLECLLKVL